MRIRALLATTAAAALVLTGCGGKQVQEAPVGQAASCEAGDGRLTLATGNTGGVYYVLGGGLAQVINQNTALRTTAAETGASVQNIQQLTAGDYDIAFTLADTAADAVAGKDAFDGKPQAIQALSRIYPNSTHVVVKADSGINSIADMRGKRISTGSPKSGTEVIANRLLQSAGLNPSADVQAQRLALGKSVDGMKSGTIDGLFWSGGLPTPEITDLTTTLGGAVKFVDITPQLPALNQISPVYEQGTIPAATYGLPADVPTVEVPNLLVVRDDFPAGNACALTRLLFDKKAELEAVHPAAKQINRDEATKTDPVPLHPGAKQALGG
ncbi:TAXI family TRAP transporter solute-binding subunit [Saccharopolyspora dendranthemae]|uniref:TRAP transporter TAXI family solute receptor n=1 Tax=Saccharopolyspora dendranthemae TaxID=1181886 RepID=A0A561U9I9_9PSEU|nr:TAXI family TRAP transporter solute-binding subunit [Saccharopolyspora dendranthemae]TWF96024.1 hypothetical protein FHU35_121025 [Saccharopolyspora dendranthemae]